MTYREVVFLSLLAWAANGRVTLTTNGYEGLVIAIGENVAEDFSLIEHIKSVMTNASSYLYTATKRRAYFKDVTILVPETWSDRAIYEPRTIERFEYAEIRIDEPVFPGSHTAYVQVSARKCGMSGIYMHITPFRLTDEEVRLLETFYFP
ncbi:calcium-activated chloride channel regulator 1-like [Corticium candelabrum]|uniref:calcium-activated chloride channel regulator 1-like n=1 Tax=Corticium candelabrum TaxID=121492 RepID=UPI002E26275E|nr:calcium-activated chloride channel regulator 1-like [Corticium candelabrum]